jgi:hypothetical protein
MKMIGFCGGSSICEVGTVSDVVLFFECLDYFVVRKNPERDWTLLTDRLYRRYLRLEELSSAIVLMNEVKGIFTNVPSSEVDWRQELIGDRSKTWLDPSLGNLADVFVKFFENFAYCAESAKLNYEGFKSYPGYQYEPVKTVPTDLAGFATEKARPLKEYDEIEGKPFWIR